MTDVSRSPSAEVGPAARVMLRPIASPIALAFAALFTGSVLLTALQLRWIPSAESHPVAFGLALLVAPLQLVGCVFAFLGRDPACATSFGVLSGTWATTAAVLLTSVPGRTSPGLGVLLLAAGFLLFIPTTAALTGKLVAGVVLGSAAVRFVLSGVVELTDSALWRDVSGIFGLVVAAFAAYGALAFELEGVLGRAVLPVLRHGGGERAVSRPPLDRLGDISAQPGVRQQL